LKKDLTAAKKKLKALKVGFVERLQKSQAELSSGDARNLTLDILKADLEGELSLAVTSYRQTVISVMENWWDKYRVTLRDIEGERDAAKSQLDGFLEELGYVV